MLFNVEQVADILKEQNVGTHMDQETDRVALDSRACSYRTLFIGLLGERVNGADFLEQALQKGANIAVLQMPEESYKAIEYKELANIYKAALFLVPNTVHALQKLAQSYVQRFPKLIKIAITGSAGKTTLKELLYTILSEKGETVATIGNLNSETGLPLCCFNIQAHHKYAVLEMGTNRPGEIEELVQVFPPNYAIITNIGSAHVGRLGSEEAIALEKRHIFDLLGPCDIAFIPQKDQFASLLAENVRSRVVFCSASTLKRFEHAQDMGLDGWIIYYHNCKIRFMLAGRHNLNNALLAIEVAYQIGIKPYIIKAGLEKIRPLSGRSQLIRGRITVFNDCYNASPESMRAALALMAPLRYARKIAMLGEMRELGSESNEIHASLASCIIEAQIDAVFLLGVRMKSLEMRLRELCYLGQIFPCSTYEQAELALINFLKDDDLLLIKGSHSMGLERLIPSLENCGFLWPSGKREVSVV